MLKKSLQLSIALFFIGSSSFAQWAGSSATSGDTYRDGNVGIGTASPVSKLHVQGESFFDGNLRLGQYTSALGYAKKLSFDDETGSDGVWFSRYMVANDATEFRLNIGDEGQAADKYVIGFTNWQTGIWTPKYFFGMDGRMGIGTDNPGSYKLAVEGSIASRGIKVTTVSPFPDYVFEPTYKLRPLSNLENYINENKHLPGIPSAKEVEKDGGIELGNMNVKLLEKVEELTLYILELNKKLAAQQKEIEQLQKSSK
ncbi:hypothetical protein [Niastella sp. OAS944]|uniref:hypothetical protein n=1 Tax=Niastella sp. OAS944 TaxID=2664089 RepID=UPI00348E66A1|nr:hypothetical protein [Chitinophagaceae bacterium OAS944]